MATAETEAQHKLHERKMDSHIKDVQAVQKISASSRVVLEQVPKRGSGTTVSWVTIAPSRIRDQLNKFAAFNDISVSDIAVLNIINLLGLGPTK